MKYIKSYTTYVLEKNSKDKNTLEIQSDDFDTSMILDFDTLSKTDKKFIKSDIDDIKDIKKSSHIKRTTGDIDSIVKKVSGLYDKEKNIVTKETFKDKFNELIGEFGKSTYVKIPENILEDPKFKDYFEIHSFKKPCVGKGEHLLSLIYPDVFRHHRTEKGDNITENNIEIEVKSAGTPFSIEVENILGDNFVNGYINEGDKDDMLKRRATLSLSTYIKMRNLGFETEIKDDNETPKKKTLLFVFFDNTIKNKKSIDTETVDIEDVNKNEEGEIQELIEFEKGELDPQGFFIMNCGETFKNSEINGSKTIEVDKDSKEPIINLANELIKHISVDKQRYKSKYKDSEKNMLCYYKDEKIHCIFPETTQHSTKDTKKDQ